MSSWALLFYDKCSDGDNSFSNKKSAVITIDDLQQNDDYIVLNGMEAIKIFNEYNVKTPSQNIPLDLDPRLYYVYIYLNREFDGNVSLIKNMYTLIAINVKLLEKIIGDKKTARDIPNYSFFRMLCNFNKMFNDTSKGITFSINENKEVQKASAHFEIIKERTHVTANYHHDPIIENPDFLAKDIKLHLYQKCTIKWMLEREKNFGHVKWGYANEVKIGNLYYDGRHDKLMHDGERNQLVFYGGAIIDEVGLGKTVMALTGSLLNRKDDASDTIKYGADTYFSSKATLIIVPNHLAGQWHGEFKKMFNIEDLNIIVIRRKNEFEKITYQDLINADFVIVTFNFFGNQSMTKEYYLTKTSLVSCNYHNSKEYSWYKMQDVLKTVNNELFAKGQIRARFKTCPILANIHWHRVLIDEFHEVYTNPKFEFLANILPLLKSSYRWIVTATPFNNNESVYNCVRFLTKYNPIVEYKGKGEQKYGYDMILANEEIVNYLISSCFRRNTHKSTAKEITLPPCSEVVMWLKFSATERMMYNSYIANPNNSKYDVYLRQLCCHPKLSDETKFALSACTSFEDIDRVMINTYRNKYENSLLVVKKIKKKINSIKRMKEKLQKKQEKKNLKSMQKTKIDIDIDESDSESSLSDVDTDTDDESITSIDHIDYHNMNADDIVQDYEDDNVLNMFVESIKSNQNIINQMKAIQKLDDMIRKLNIRFERAKKELRGHEASYNFYLAVLKRLKKIVGIDEFKEIKDGDDESKEAGEESSDSDSDNDDEECAICFNEIASEDVGVTACGHIFCYECLKATCGTSGTKCPTCMRPLKEQDISMFNYEPIVAVTELTKEQKLKMELINEVGTKLGNLIELLKSDDKHTIIFSQWDDLLVRIGSVLAKYGIKNVFCKGNVFMQEKAIRDFTTDDSIKVIMLSSKNSASGTNLTKAKRVVLIDPVYGTYEFRKATERQAIGRVHRLGQTAEVEIIRLVIRSTIEEEIHNENKIENAKFDEKIKVIETVV